MFNTVCSKLCEECDLVEVEIWNIIGTFTYLFILTHIFSPKVTNTEYTNISVNEVLKKHECGMFLNKQMWQASLDARQMQTNCMFL